MATIVLVPPANTLNLGGSGGYVGGYTGPVSGSSPGPFRNVSHPLRIDRGKKLRTTSPSNREKHMNLSKMCLALAAMRGFALKAQRPPVPRPRLDSEWANHGCAAFARYPADDRRRWLSALRCEGWSDRDGSPDHGRGADRAEGHGCVPVTKQVIEKSSAGRKGRGPRARRTEYVTVERR